MEGLHDLGPTRLKGVGTQEIGELVVFRRVNVGIMSRTFGPGLSVDVGGLVVGRVTSVGA